MEGSDGCHLIGMAKPCVEIFARPLPRRGFESPLLPLPLPLSTLADTHGRFPLLSTAPLRPVCTRVLIPQLGQEFSLLKGEQLSLPPTPLMLLSNPYFRPVLPPPLSATAFRLTLPPCRLGRGRTCPPARHFRLPPPSLPRSSRRAREATHDAREEVLLRRLGVEVPAIAQLILASFLVKLDRLSLPDCSTGTSRP